MRQIEQKMIDYLDGKLATNGLAQDAIAKKLPRALLVEAAKMCVGITEKTGRNDGPMVELIQETIGGHGGEAWCMAFMQTCIAYVEQKLGVVSLLAASEHCMTVWNDSPRLQRVQYNPLPGAIVIWRHGSSTNGHTGVVLACDENEFHAVEGNTTGGENAKGEVVRDGGGVHFTVRNRKGNGDMKVMGFLKPF
jgi:hypothetical protein